MELVTNEIKCDSVKQTIRVHHLTDTHIDDHDHADKELRARIQQIADDPNAYWIGGGDYYSLILPSDRRFETPMEASVHRLPDVYIEGCVERFLPIADKCIGFGTGNHEATVQKNYHRGVAAETVMQLGIPEKYLGVRGWMIMKFNFHSRRQALKLYQYHGWSAGRLKGRKAIQAERDVGAWRADAFFLGHDHQPYADVFWTQECYDTKKGYRLRNRPVAVVNGGSWTYGQRTPATPGTKKYRKPSEWPNEAWVEGRNFRPQAPVSPILEIHLDFGYSPSKEDRASGDEGRATGFEFEIRQRAGMFDV